MRKKDNKNKRRLVRIVTALLMGMIVLTACGSGGIPTEEIRMADSESAEDTAPEDTVEAEADAGQGNGPEEENDEGQGKSSEERSDAGQENNSEEGNEAGRENASEEGNDAGQESNIDTEGDGNPAALEEEETAEPELLNIPVWITANNVNLRAEPNTESEVLKKLGRNAKFTLRYEKDGWGAVEDDNLSGFVSAEYLTREEPSANAFVVVIDPGHQRKGDSTPEPNGPDSSTMKARVTGGTSGRTTGVMEYELTLAVSLKLRDELEARGYTVYMTRETHDVNISNMERAQYATSVDADAAVRIHANGVEDASVSGALALTPSASNPYVSHLAADSQTLSQCILDAYCDATGMRNQGVVASDTMTGINWSTVPVTILEMGYMTNPSDDTNMEDEAYQEKMIQGIADGIDAYFRIG